MRLPAHIPEVHEQTAIRVMEGFWITDMSVPPLQAPPLPESPFKRSKAPRFGAWLIRSAANPDWHGFRGIVPKGTAPHTVLLDKCAAIAGIEPYAMDLVAVMQPDDQPDITRTTFIKSCQAEGLPRLTLPGIELGIFPIEKLPVSGTRRNWLPELLCVAVEEGMSPAVITREQRFQ